MYIVERFEGNWAVIETEDRLTFNLPRSILPVELKEGDVLDILVTVNQAATRKRREQSKNLLNDFFS